MHICSCEASNVSINIDAHEQRNTFKSASVHEFNSIIGKVGVCMLVCMLTLKHVRESCANGACDLTQTGRTYPTIEHERRMVVGMSDGITRGLALY